MKTSFAVGCIATIVSGTACAAKETSEFRAAPNADYPDHQVVRTTDEYQRQQKQSSTAGICTTRPDSTEVNKS